MEDNQAPEKLSSLRVRKLFGRFTHDLRFSETDDISIITAPNGYGKTVLLRIIDSVFNRKLHFFRKIGFSEIEIEFASGKSILIFKQQTDLFEEDSPDEPPSVSIKSHGFGADNDVHHLSPSFSASDLRHFERHLPVERMGPDVWFDHIRERTFSTDQLVDLYADALPNRLIGSVSIPEWLQNAIGCVDAHLVETQRLLYLEGQEGRRPHSKRGITPSSVVEKDAADLAEHIGRLLQQYANESQKLDQTFPMRILEFRDGTVSDEDRIRGHLHELAQKRDALVSVGLLGSTISEPIQPSNVFQEKNIRRILEIYVEDTRQKLSIFDATYEKIRLFKQILDERFSFKTIEIDSEHGIRAIDEGNQQVIPLSELSSGEQHELVLVYELLFKVEEGSVILIDEPELSLHVTWQKHFISDLQKIKELRKIDVIMATHSPQIIQDKWDFVQELKA